MEHLDIGEKRYVKVSSAARETGYTTDYIGQLCRAKKIDAKLVGRTWYVAYDELLAHRQTRGRSSHEKAKKAFKQEVASIGGETRIPISIEHTGVRKRIVSEHITYHSDESELIPTPVAINTPKKVPEQKLEVKEDKAERPVKFNTEEKPEIKWNGTIVVQSLAEQEAEDEITSNSKAKTAPLTRHIHIRDREKATAVEIQASTQPQDPLLQRERFLSRVNRAHDLNSLEEALETSKKTEMSSVAKAPTVEEVETLGTKVHTWVYNTTLTIVCLVLMVGLAGFFLEQNSIYIGGTNGNNSAPYYQKGFSFLSVSELKNSTNTTISSIRDMFKNKL